MSLLHLGYKLYCPVTSRKEVMNAAREASVDGRKMRLVPRRNLEGERKTTTNPIKKNRSPCLYWDRLARVVTAAAVEPFESSGNSMYHLL
jgi:hypothetical protein